MSSGSLDVRLASNMDELMQVAAVRAIVMVEELQRPYRDEFNMNDLACSWVLATQADEPVGVMSLRYFGDFVKFGSLGVRARYRSLAVSNSIVRYAIQLARTKGFTRVYGHALPQLVRFWSRHGFHPSPDMPAQEIEPGVVAVPMLGEFPALPDSERIHVLSAPLRKQAPEAGLGRPRPSPAAAVAA